MKKLFVIPAALTLAINATFALAGNPGGYNTLSFDDEFNGNSLDLTKWDYRALGARGGAVQVRSAVTETPGNLAITTSYNSALGQFQTGMISTENTFLQKYGYFETRLQEAAGVGQHWDTFWMQSPLIQTALPTPDPTDYGTEVDIAEYRPAPNALQSALHWNGYAGGAQSVEQATTPNGFTRGSWHTFGFLWTPTSYTFYVDGTQTWTTTQAISQLPEYMILCTEVPQPGSSTASWVGGSTSPSNFPDGINVAYVRAYTSATPGTLLWDSNTTTAGAQGGTGAWNTNAGNNLWYNNTIHSNVPWDSASIADFAGTAGTVTAGTVSVGGLQFDTAGYVLTGGTITFNSGAGIVANASATISSNITGPVNGITTAAGAILTNSPANKAALTVSGPIVNNGEISTADSCAVYITGAYSDSSTGILLNQDGGLSTRGSGHYNTPANFANHGFHFANGQTNNVYSAIQSLPYSSSLPSPMIIVDGVVNNGVTTPTTVNFHGTWHGEGGLNSVYNELTLTHGSTFYVASDAAFDIVLSDNQDQWARQLWLAGDGTGSTLELDPNFIAVQDHSVGDPYHANRNILGSIQMCGGETVITHSSQSLPVYRRYLVSDSTPSNINGHMSFWYDAGGAPKWQVATNAQTYAGAIWAYVNATIQTDVDLTSTGVDHYESAEGYNALNGFRIFAANSSGTNTLGNTFNTVTKTGVGNLNLNGDQAYAPNSVLQINAGGVNFNTDPGDTTVHYNSNTTFGGQTLTVNVAANGHASFNAAQNHIAALNVVDGQANIKSNPASPVWLYTQALTLSGNGTLDVTDGRLAVQYTGASNYAAVLGYVTASYDGNNWDKPGITSSAVLGTLGGSHPYALAVIDGAGANNQTSLTGNATYVVPALVGDIRLTGTVDFGDYQIFLSNYGTGTTWETGDFHYSGTADFGDYQKLLQNFGAVASLTSAQLASIESFGAQFGAVVTPNADGFGFTVAVPEPNSAMLALAAFSTLSTRRRRA